VRKPNRPPELTPEVIALCRLEFEQSSAVPPGWTTGLLGDVLWEVWLSGYWLRNQLVERGAPEKMAQDICFAHGQMSVGRDPWLVTKELLKQFELGFKPEPGRELAEALLQGAPVQVTPVNPKDES